MPSIGAEKGKTAVMRCEHCFYQFGVTDTRCRNCGCRPSRVRVSVIGIICLACGLGIGWSVERLIQTDVSRTQRWHHARSSHQPSPSAGGAIKTASAS